MALKRGFAKVKEIKEAGGKGSGGGLRFRIGDGESAIVRFFGDFENQQDPIIGVNHYIRRLAIGSQYHNCTDNLPEGSNQNCVFCHVMHQGDKGIKKQNRAFLWLKDLRKVHKLEQEVRVLKPGVVFRPGVANSDTDYTTTKYPPCSAPKRICAYCRQGSVPMANGFRSWELAVTYADMLVSQQTAIRDMCKCGAKDEEGNGTIAVSRYLCSNPECMSEVDFDPNQGRPVAGCGSCGQTLPPLEEITCANCDSPQRCDLQDFLFKVTRTGSGTDTTYNFEPVQFKPPSQEDIDESISSKPDFEALLQPEAPELQASKLGIPSPFHTAGHGAQTYAAAPARRVSFGMAAPQPTPARLGPPKLMMPRRLAAPQPVETSEVDYE